MRGSSAKIAGAIFGCRKHLFTFILLASALAILLFAVADADSSSADLDTSVIAVSDNNFVYGESVATLSIQNASSYTGLEVEYEWYRDSTLVSTDETFTAVYASDSGSYHVVLTVSDETSTSAAVDVAISCRPITVQSGSDSKTYDGEPLTKGGYSIISGTLAGGDTATFTPTGTITNVGTEINTFTFIVKKGEVDVTSSYTITANQGSLTVLPREAVIGWGELSHTYDAIAWAPTATVTNLCEGDVCNVTVTGGQSQAGTGYVATAASLDNGNYVLPSTLPTTTFTIDKRQVSFTSGSQSFQYDGKPHVFKALIIGGSFAEGDIPNVNAIGTITYYTENAPNNNTISTLIVTRGGVDVTSNYEAEYYPGTLTITKRPITVSTGSSTSVYTRSPLTNSEHTITSGTLADGDTDSITTTGSITNVGSTDNTFNSLIMRGDVDVTVNYDITPSYGALTVLPKEIGVEWGLLTHVYDSYIWVPSATATGLCAPDTCTINVTGGKVFCGTYTATASALDNGNYKLPDTLPTAEFSITVRTLIVTSGTDSMEYDGTALTDDSYIAEEGGVADGDYLSDVSVTGSITYYTDNAPNNNTVSGAVVRATEGDEDVSSNYDIRYVFGTLTITKRPITISTGSDEKVYDGLPLTLAGCSLTSGSIADGDTNMSTATGSITDVGSNDNTLQKLIKRGDLDVTDNYEITESLGVLTVTPKEIGIAWGSTKHIYDSSEWTPSATATKLCGSDECNVTVTGGGIYCGTYTATAASIDNGNYKLPDPAPTVSFEITKRQITITSGSSSKTYDGAALTDSSYSVTAGFIQGEDQIISISTTGSITFYAEDPTGNNTVSDAIIMRGTVIATSNYNITYVAGTLTINKRPITVMTGTYDKTYDGTPLTYDLHILSSGELAPGDDDFIHTSGTLTNVGVTDNTFVPLIKRGHQDVTTSYEISSILGILEIHQKEIGITWGTTVHVYDATLWAPSATAQGLCGEDVCNVTVTGMHTYIGEYTATAAAIDNGNYILPETKPTHDYSITPRPITVTSRSISKVYDGTPLVLNEFDIGGDGLAGPDTISVVITGSITYFSENAEGNNTIVSTIVKKGDQVITPSYQITTVAGTLEIMKRPITISTGSASKVYDGSALTKNTYSISEGSLATGDSEDVSVNGSITNYGTADNTFSVTITRSSVDVISNYEITPSYGTLAITKKELTPSLDFSKVTSKIFDNTTDFNGHGASIVLSGVVGTEKPTVTATYVLDSKNYGETGLSAVDIALGESWINYSLSSNSVSATAPGNLVEKKEISLVVIKSPYYDGKAYTYSVKKSDFEGMLGTEVGGEITTNNSDVGTYSQKGSLSTNWSYKTALSCDSGIENYTVIEYVEIEILQTTVTVTAKSVSRVYDGTPLTCSEIESDVPGLAEGHTVVPVITGTITTIGNVPNVLGSVVIKDAGNNDVTSNYIVQKNNGTLEITRRPLVISVDVEKVFDASALTASYTQMVGDNLVYGDSFDDGLFTTSGSAVYDYTVKGTDWKVTMSVSTVNGIGNYDVSYSVSMEIKKRPVNITVDSQHTYDGAAYTYIIKTADASNLLSDDAITAGKLTTTNLIVGTYTVADDDWTVTEAVGITHGVSNYDVKFQAVSLKIGQRLLTATPNDGWSKVFDGTTLFTGYVLGNTVEGDDIGLVANFNSTEVLAADTISFTKTGDDSGNYAAPAAVSASITKKSLIVTVDPSVVCKVYDTTGLEFTLTDDNLTGLVTGDSITDGILATTDVKAKVYTWTNGDCVFVTDHGLSVTKGLSNYEPSYSGISMAINPATITSVSVTGYSGTYDTFSHCVYTALAGTTVDGSTITWVFSDDGETWLSIINVSDAQSRLYYYKASALNHNDVTGTFTVTIAKAIVADPADFGSKVYTGTFQSSILTETADYTVSPNGGTDAGAYDVELVLKQPKNYKWADVDTPEKTFVDAFQITRAPVTIQNIVGSKTYTGTALSIEITDPGKIIGLVGGDSFVSGRILSVSDNVGLYNSKDLLVADIVTEHGFDNYDPSYVGVSLSINNALITVTSITGYSGLYDGEYHTAIVSITYQTVNDQSAVVKAGPTVEECVVDYKVKDACSKLYKYQILAPNHSDYVGDFFIYIQKATINDPPQTDFGEKLFNNTVQVSDIDDTGKPYMVTKNDGGKDIGGYDVELTLRDPVNTMWSDQTEAAKTFVGAFRIVAAVMTINIVGNMEFNGEFLTVNYDSTYTDSSGTHPCFTVTGLVDGDSLTAGSVMTIGITAGTYSVKGSDWIVNDAIQCVVGISKYKVEFGTVALTITTKPISIAVNMVEEYDGTYMASKLSHISCSDIVSSDYFTEGSFRTKGSNVGIYATPADYETVKFFDTSYGIDNYIITSYTVSLTILERDIEAIEVVMSIEGNELTYSAKQQTQKITKLYIPSLNNLDISTYNLSDNIQKDSGDYTMTIEGTGNFKGTITRPFTIAKAVIARTSAFNVAIDEEHKECIYYSGDEIKPIVKIRFNNAVYLVEGTEYTVSYPSLQPAIDAEDRAEVHITAVEGSNFTGEQSWYFTVLPAELIVTAKDITITYGDVLSGYGYTVVGFKKSDHITGEAIYSTNYAQYDDSGVYWVTVTAFTPEPKENPGYKSYNYHMNFLSGNVYVNKYQMTLSITPNGGTYGNVVPASAEFITPIHGDVIEPVYFYEGDANDGTHYADNPPPSLAGTYTVKVSMSGVKSVNYKITGSDSAPFIVGKADEATPDAGSKVYNAAVQKSDLVDNEIFTVDINDGGTIVGEYSVILTMCNDYWYNHKWADFTTQTILLKFVITPAPLSVTAYPNTIVYGDVPAPSPHGVSYSGWQGDDDESLITGTPTYTYSYSQYGDVGEYAITPGGVSAANYETVPCDGVLTVVPLDRQAEWSCLDQYVYSGDAYNFPGATIKGIGSGGEYQIVLIVMCDHDEFKNAGDYLFTATTDNINYTVTDGTKGLTIQPLAVDVIWPDTEYIYKGEEFPLPIASFTGVKEQVFGVDVTQITVNRFINAGDYSFEASTTDTNYSLSTGTTEKTYTIIPRTVTIEWDAPSQGYTYNGYNQTVSQPRAKFYGVGIDKGYIPAPVVEKDSKTFMHAGDYVFLTSDETFLNYTFTNERYDVTMKQYSTRANWKISPTGYTYDGTIQDGPTCSIRGIGYDPQFIAMDVFVQGEQPFLNAGTYTFVATNTNTDYLVSDMTKDIVMSKYNVKCTWTYDGGKDYTGYDLVAPTATFIALTGETVDLVITEDEGKAFRDAGTYNFTAVCGDSYIVNYNPTYNTKKVTINPVEATIEWENIGDRAYSGYAQTPASGSFQGIGEDGVVSIIVIEKDGKTFRDADSYIFLATLARENYVFTNGSVSITVSPVTVKAVWEDRTYVYSGTQFDYPKAALAVIGEDTPEQMDVEKLFSQLFKNAGDYRFRATTANTNYLVPDNEIQYTIERAKTEASWSIPDYVYNGNSQSLPVVTAPSKDKGPLTLTVIVSDGRKFVNAATYGLEAINTDGNYDVSNTSADVTIRPYVLTVIPDSSIEFDAVTNYSETLVQGVVYEKIGIRCIASDASVGKYHYATAPASGYYTVEIFDAERCLASNYMISSTVSAGVFEILPVSISKVTVELPSLIYNATEQTPEPVVMMSGKVLERDVDYQYSITDYQNNRNAGTATLTLTGIGSLVDIKIATFQIYPCPVKIDSASKTYDGNSGYSERLMTSLSEIIAIKYTAYSSDSGSYIYSGVMREGCYTAELIDDTASASNYELYAQGMYAFTIHPALITTLGTVSKVYDASALYSMNIDTGVNGEVLIAEYRAYSKDVSVNVYSATSGPGQYTAKLVDNGYCKASNYTLSINESTAAGLYTIVPAYVTIPSQTVTYNGCDGTKTVQVSTFKGEFVELKYTAGSSLAGTYVYSSELSAGTYKVEMLEGFFSISNYRLSDEGAGTFTIQKAQLIARYTGETVACGNAPALTVKVMGFVNSESESTARGYVRPTVSLKETAAGSYVLTPEGGNAYNYDFKYESGTLVINHDLKYVGASDISKTIAHYECKGCHRSFTDTTATIEYFHNGDSVVLQNTMSSATLSDETALNLAQSSYSVVKMNPNANLVLELMTPNGKLVISMENYPAVISNANAIKTFASGSTVSMPQSVLAELVSSDGTFDLTVKETKDYPEKYASLVGKNGVVYDYALIVDDISRASFNGKVTISIPYVLKDGQDASNVHVYYLGATSAERYECTYSNGMASFDTEHFSSYLVVYEDPGEAGPNYLIIAVIAGVCVAIVAIMLLGLRRRF